MNDARIFVEHTLSEEELLQLVDEDERRTALSFGSARRRREFMMWRHIVRRELGRDTLIAYSETGAPFLPGRAEHIGVSHSADMVAVIISERHCAIDIEDIGRDFSRAASRFMTPDECALGSDPRLQAAVWCAKETLYKYSGKKGLSLTEDITVTGVDFDNSTISGRIEGSRPIELRMRLLENNLIVYIG
ncbi:MAG TPA: 4'-phosphopantetheinyl transferase superfamily protein [Candidatus Alistipes excrementipullorum]|nr:4'-phosphopantetheinyl transferase superfamily protein [Candidatus Alistipes excrementipullorum]